jgi:phage gp16-like protein
MPTRNELVRIHIAKKELGLDDSSYRAILRDRYRKESSAHLTGSEAEDLIDLFRQKGWRPASLAQRGLIYALWRRLESLGGINHPGEKALASFIEHATGKDSPRRLTVREASRVIEMLKNWLERVEGRGTRH